MTEQIMHPLGSRDYDKRGSILAKGQKEGYPGQAPDKHQSSLVWASSGIHSMRPINEILGLGYGHVSDL